MMMMMMIPTRSVILGGAIGVYSFFAFTGLASTVSRKIFMYIRGHDSHGILGYLSILK